jgi:hypothetical protein
MDGLFIDTKPVGPHPQATGMMVNELERFSLA